jgi:adenylate kinase
MATDRASWLTAGATPCKIYDPFPERPYRMILLGAPGIGKGTQAAMLCERFKTCHLSTGDLFRCALQDTSERSPAMWVALEHMKRGELVPDQTVIDLVRERLHCIRCDYGFLLDGFPRTVQQARALDNMFAELGLVADAVINYELPVETVVERLGGRRTCLSCKATFHLRSLPPKVAGVCDHCGGDLYQREDDRPESIRVRLAAYEQNTAPLKDYYAAVGLLVTISADGTPQQVFDRTLDALWSRSRS